MNILNNKTKQFTFVRQSLAAAMIATLAACGDSSSSQQNVIEGAPQDAAVSRLSFKPADGVVPLPSDLLFSGTTDGTLEVPDEVAGRASGGADYTAPGTALGALDGWSTQMPVIFDFDMASGTTVDGSSLLGNFRVFETYKSNGVTCNGIATPFPSGLPCAPTDTELTYGSDFVASASDSRISLVFLKPLSPATTYVVAVLDGINDSAGNGVQASATYQLLKDTQEDLSDNAALSALQGAISIYEGMIQAGSGGAVNSDDLIYSMAMTTQSVGNDLAVHKLLLASNPPAISVTNTGQTVQAVLTGVLGSDPGAAYSIANYYTGTITLPYYLALPSQSNPTAPINTPWQAMCDNGVLLSSGITGTVGVNDTACQAFGLRDFGLDIERHMSQYNPVPQVSANVAVDVQMTVPAAGCGGACPVVILQHGITSTKEAMLLMTASLSASGFATIAIDHPLHGSRGFDLDGDTVDDINASTVSGTHYMNLGALLVARDNLKQSMADMLGLRRGLQSFSSTNDGTAIDTTRVYVAGLSLGGISSVGFAALANSSVDTTFNIQNISIHSAGGGIAPFLNESGSFGPIVQSSVILAAGTDLSDELAAFIAETDPSCEALTPGSEPFVSCQYNAFVAQLVANQEAAKLAEINSTLSSFTFAAQTVIDAGDPNNFAQGLVATGTPVHLTEIIGDGGANLPDQVIPNQTTSVPFGGTEPLATLLGLSGVDTTTIGGALVRFTKGKHSSLLDPSASAEAPDAEANLAVTTEIQTQSAAFFLTGNTVITDATYVAPAD
jgi:Pla-1/cef family extracellular lipase